MQKCRVVQYQFLGQKQNNRRTTKKEENEYLSYDFMNQMHYKNWKIPRLIFCIFKIAAGARDRIPFQL